MMRGLSTCMVHKQDPTLPISHHLTELAVTHNHCINLSQMSAPSTDSVSAVTSVASSQMDNQVLPIFDAFLDLPHPAASTTINDRRIIIAPPQGEAFNRSKDVGVELATEKGLQRVASFCFPEFQEDLYGA